MAHALVVVPLTISSSSRADVSESSRNLAQALFDQARELLAAGRYAEACQKFEESQRLDPGGGTVLNLALCHEKQGKLATAWADFRESLDAARRDRRAEREKLAREHLEALEPRLPRLTVRVPAATANPRVEVMLDGIALNESAWGTPVPVDPGPHTVEARAVGKKKWQAEVRLQEREQVALVVPALEDEAGGFALSSSSPSPDGVATQSNGRRRAAYVLGGFGVVALGVGTYFGISAIQKRQDADTNGCGDTTCNNAGAADTNASSVTDAWISNVAFGAGLVATGLAAYWLLTLPPTAPSPSTARASTPRSYAFPLTVAPLADRTGAFAAWRSSW